MGGRIVPTINDQRVFLPTKNLDQSIDFYTRMGWQVRFRDDKLAMVALGASSIFLQDYIGRSGPKLRALPRR